MKKYLTTLTAITVANISPATVHGRAAFVAPNQSRAKLVSPMIPSLKSPCTQKSQPTTSTSLKMGYQLPPSGPSGPKGPLDDIKALLPTIGAGILVALFFASPLGGIFFAITNSLFVLALLTPILLYVGFQAWTAFYTVEAPCPSCGRIPIRVLKDGSPSACLNCGAFSRANEKGDGLELCNNPNSMMDQGMGGSLFDSLFGGMGDMGDMGGDTNMGGGTNPFDVMGGGAKKTSPEEQANKAKRQGTIIDVDVERD